ncbi:tyrosine-type recombinase/integrase [Catenulispora sp. NF23]|uniref:tyrosine-type recombinase/integrase n=1 Tax=Catenulispora pinistramenti TaxID=2705254 RepID=UPI001BA6BEDB|nr:tyrosine-type recombinase/integrase [Catenulispora pinistramenti]MBS2531975.1 tyrosine-type recombinase/integrase [Catenulispora pinistramenti]
MRVRRVIGSGAVAETYTVVDDDGHVVDVVDDFLAVCTDREMSPNTIRAKAFDLKAWLEFLALTGTRVEDAVPEHLDRFAAWLRRPVLLGQLKDAEDLLPKRDPRSVNRMLSSVHSFYTFLDRRGVSGAGRLAAYHSSSWAGFAGFLEGIVDVAGRERHTRLKEVKKRPLTLTDGQVQAILNGCDRLRDRFLMALMFETGCRIGQALGLRHGDIDTTRPAITLVPRADNVNRARGKSREAKQIPVRSALLDLYTDYLFAEYGEIDSDYLFLNLWGGQRGRPMTYWSVMSLVKRLRARTGVEFHPHMFRHTHATALLRAGVRLEIVADLLTHSTGRTTAEFYDHLDADDLAEELLRTGFWESP